ncbi:MAG: hypothetical protein AVDCRST_MAG19-4544 [uncultured Thermomicrobiales bacterium]|uniref:ABC transporter domain-containing protein n=1 Tax=uncultured Thermomicrobiales bacterium TaxID=1645740 RepID=A0A6J4VQ26_9BACT|nr:MAG: hypothetical protein AVDCRST_MAG19-4544 [uncultured Thermomicrobiales bacterium]
MPPCPGYGRNEAAPRPDGTAVAPYRAANAVGCGGSERVTTPTIEVDDLGRDFGGFRAVDGLSFAVPAGTVFGFLGPNGSGKTTTIRLLLGLLEPSRGRATVFGHDSRLGADEIRRRSGALLEHPGLYERLTAEENLDFFGRAWRLSERERLERGQELLRHLGLWERRRERVGAWSRGQRQKLAIARVLLHRPELIFLDEPTAGLDPVASASLRHDIAALAGREGRTVFLTTHNLAEAEQLCGLVGVIRRGRLLALGHPDELRARAGGPRAEIVARGLDAAMLARVRDRPEVATAELRDGRLLLDLRAGADVAAIVALLVGGGAAVEEVRRGAATLEEAFLGLMKETR